MIDDYMMDDEDKYQYEARYCRKIAGKCPAIRYYKNEAYCSRAKTCDHGSEQFIMIGEQLYFICKFVEKDKGLNKLVGEQVARLKQVRDRS